MTELSICVGSSHHSGPRVLPAFYSCWIHTPELPHSRDHGCSLPPPDHTSSHHSWHNSVLLPGTSSPAPPPCHRPPWSWEQSPRAPDPRGMSAWQVYTWIRSDDTHCSSLWSWTHCDKTEHTGAVLRTNILCQEIDHVKLTVRVFSLGNFGVEVCAGDVARSFIQIMQNCQVNFQRNQKDLYKFHVYCPNGSLFMDSFCQWYPHYSCINYLFENNGWPAWRNIVGLSGPSQLGGRRTRRCNEKWKMC